MQTLQKEKKKKKMLISSTFGHLAEKKYDIGPRREIVSLGKTSPQLYVISTA